MRFVNKNEANEQNDPKDQNDQENKTGPSEHESPVVSGIRKIFSSFSFVFIAIIILLLSYFGQKSGISLGSSEQSTTTSAFDRALEQERIKAERYEESKGEDRVQQEDTALYNIAVELFGQEAIEEFVGEEE